MIIHGKTTPSIVALAERLQDVACSIRWGGATIREGFNGRCNFYNGLQQLQKFGAADVPSVDFTNNRATAQQWVATGAIVLGRRVNHTQGRDIVVPGHPHWPFRDYWTKYVEAADEWRFHIFKGKSIGRAKKVRIDRRTGEVLLNAPDTHPIIRSRRRGWHMEHDTDPPKGARKLAKDAIRAVGYDFGAVDIIRLADGTFRVLEVNARPALRDNYTLDAYASAIRKEVQANV